MKSNSLKEKADEIISLIDKLPGVKKCSVYGSLAANTYDELSDIDIEIDVSGYDNGIFMLELPHLLKDKLNIYYIDYAPSLVPDKYIVSIAIDKENPFLIVDFLCSAVPHCTSVTKQQILEKNGKYTHMLKLWTANLKHYVRGEECRKDILKMAGKITAEATDDKGEAELLAESLHWLEANTGYGLEGYVKALRRKFDELVK